MGELTGNMYLVKLRGADEKAMITPKVSGKMLRGWHFRLEYSGMTAITQTMAPKADARFNKADLQSERSLFTTC